MNVYVSVTVSVSVCVCDKYAPQEQVLSLAVKKTRPQEALPIYFATVLWITGNNTFQKEIFSEHRYRKSCFSLIIKNSGQIKREEKKTRPLELRELDSYLSLPLTYEEAF